MSSCVNDKNDKQEKKITKEIEEVVITISTPILIPPQSIKIYKSGDEKILFKIIVLDPIKHSYYVDSSIFQENIDIDICIPYKFIEDFDYIDFYIKEMIIKRKSRKNFKQSFSYCFNNIKVGHLFKLNGFELQIAGRKISYY